MEHVSANKWEMAEMVVKAFIDAHPTIWAIFCEDMRMERQGLLDQKYARTRLTVENKNYNHRKLASFPADFEGNSLLTQIEKFYPKLTKNKKLFREFLRKFPYFRIPEEL